MFHIETLRHFVDRPGPEEIRAGRQRREVLLERRRRRAQARVRHVEERRRRRA